MIAIG